MITIKKAHKRLFISSSSNIFILYPEECIGGEERNSAKEKVNQNFDNIVDIS